MAGKKVMTYADKFALIAVTVGWLITGVLLSILIYHLMY